MEKMQEYKKRIKSAGRKTAAGCLLALCFFLGGCGRDEDPAGNQVLEITITPPPTATPAPDQVNPDAVAKEENLTMVNGYLVEGIGTARSVKNGQDPGEEEDGTDAEQDSGEEEEGADTEQDSEEEAGEGDGTDAEEEQQQ